MNQNILKELNTIPHKSGIYQMFNKNDEIIYIGKAKDLYKRVSQYFLKPQNGKVAAMVFNVDHFKTIITNNEKESLILEMNLIHKYLPKYNILLKDGSHYPYIALKKGDQPSLTLSRNKKNNSYYFYYGPYPNSGAAYKVIELLNNIFPFKKCKNTPKKTCLYYHLKTCLGYCVNKVSKEKIEEMQEETKKFLNGDTSYVKNKLKNNIKTFSENMEFERAAETKKLLDSIDEVIKKQNVESNDKTSKDIIAYSTRDGYLCLTILTFRNGLLLGKDNFIVNEFEEEDFVLNLIQQYYSSHELPSLIVSNIKDINVIQKYFDVKVLSPLRGSNYELIRMALDNSKNSLDEHFSSKTIKSDKQELLNTLGELLKIETPYMIELFDNSHLNGSSPVGASVCFYNGEPLKRNYRKYKLSDEVSGDDYHSMKEIVKRHYSRLKEENLKLPDLIILDGGLTQLRACKDVLKELNLNINCASLFKNDKHQTEGLLSQNEKEIKLEKSSPLFFMLMKMQDEVHRFAITFHKNTRNKSMTKSIFDDIKGLGKVRLEKLKNKYQTIDELKNASIEELSQIVPKDVAEEIKNKI